MDILNETPFTIGLIGGRAYFPGHSLTVVVKATFDLRPDAAVEPSEDQLPPTGDEEFESDEDETPISLRYPSDFAHFKPRADLLLVGRAHAPDGVDVEQIDVAFRVGERGKVLRVSGERWWTEGIRGAETTRPRPFAARDLRYENAYGGPDFSSNPAGKGHAPVMSDAGYRVHPVPDIEDPRQPADRPERILFPAGFGPLHPRWRFRASKLGTYSDEWLQTRWPWFAEDLDWGYFNAAPPDMQVDGYLSGDEEVVLENLDREWPRLAARLPGLRLRCFLQETPADAPGPGEADGAPATPAAGRDARFRELPLQLDTLWVDAEARKVVLAWRGLAEVRSEDFDEVEYLYVCSEPLQDAPRPVEEVREAFEAAVRTEAFEPEAPVTLEELVGPTDPAPDPDVEMDEARQHLDAKLAEAGLDPIDASPAEASSEPTDGEGAERPAGGPLSGRLDRADVEALLAADETLSGRDLAGADLTGLDLTGVDLTGASLTGVDLRRAVLDGADLSDATLDTADLSGASARGTSLAGADLTRASLAGADLTGAELEGAILEGADLGTALLEEARGSDAICTDANLRGVRARRSAFPGADFGGAVLQEADFREADLGEADMEGTAGMSADFSRARLEGVRAVDGADFSRALFAEAEAAGSLWSESRLVDAEFGYADLKGVEFSGADLTGANLSAADMKEGRLAGARLRNAGMVRCNLFEASLEKADLRGADLRGSNLYGAEVLDARLEDALLDGANLKMTKLDTN